jgi:hypothetical protein
MRLTEFYSLSEGHDSYYTIEPNGRLIEWDQAMIADEENLSEEMSYEVIAHGNNGTLLEELGRRLSLTAEDIDKIEYNLSMGCQVTVLREGNEVIVRL